MADRKRNRAVIEVDSQLLSDFSDLISSKSDTLLRNILADIYPADIALIINNLKGNEALELFKVLPHEIAAEVLLELDTHIKELILNTLDPIEISNLVTQMDSDDATDIVAELKQEIAQKVLPLLKTEDLSEVKELLRYGKNTAGGIMAKEFIDLKETDTIQQAIKEIKEEAVEGEHAYNIWVTDEDRRLIGTVSLMNIILSIDNPFATIGSIMDTEVISVDVDTDQEDVAKIFQKYNLVSLPVVNRNKQLVGRISIDDIVDVMEAEFSEDVAKIVGSDVEELQSKSPTQIAFMRLPWVLITLSIQFLAGLVVHFYDHTLSKVILLASFMPIISAISGNTGLQAAAVVVRSLATGHVSLNRWKEPIKRQLQITLIIGLVCGFIVGTIGGIWYGKIMFGIIVGLSMFLSINISGLIGSSTPLISKRLGFDPAITVGPFETAFQDVIGITVFLTLSTVFLSLIL